MSEHTWILLWDYVWSRVFDEVLIKCFFEHCPIKCFLRISECSVLSNKSMQNLKTWKNKKSQKKVFRVHHYRGEGGGGSRYNIIFLHMFIFVMRESGHFTMHLLVPREDQWRLWPKYTDRLESSIKTFRKTSFRKQNAHTENILQLHGNAFRVANDNNKILVSNAKEEKSNSRQTVIVQNLLYGCHRKFLHASKQLPAVLS